VTNESAREDETPGPEHRLPNRFVDSDHPAIVAWAAEHGAGETPRELAVSLYYAVRDGFRYSPWGVYFDPEAFCASTVLLRDESHGAHCVDKAN
jgi:transglutaminase-like putative cysteine protease